MSQHPFVTKSEQNQMTGIAFAPSSGDLLYVDTNNVMTQDTPVSKMPIMRSYQSLLLSIDTSEHVTDESSCVNKDCGTGGMCVDVEDSKIVCICSRGFIREEHSIADSKCIGKVHPWSSQKEVLEFLILRAKNVDSNYSPKFWLKNVSCFFCFFFNLNSIFSSRF